MTFAGVLCENELPADSGPGVDDVLSFADMDENHRREYWATLALRHTPGLGTRKRTILLKHFRSAYGAFENVDSWGSLGIARKIVQSLITEQWRKAAQEEWTRAARLDASILLWSSALYPSRLRELPDAPALLYCLGDTALLSAPAIAIVGSRQATSHGLAVASSFGRTISSCGITLISGMADGIDSAAHAGALKFIGKSIGVLGTGIDKIYPLANKALFQDMGASGLLISEFAPGTPPIAANFPIRNRIISGIAFGVVVVEAATRSGSLITARLALEQNREVFAVPSPALDARSLGCQNLIRQGAIPVFCVDDVLNNLKEQLSPWKLRQPVAVSPDNFIPPPSPPDSTCSANGPHKHQKGPQKTEPEFKNEAAQKLISDDKSTQIVSLLQNNGPMHIDMIATVLELDTGELNALLVGLEMFGKVKRLPGARFEAGCQ